MGWSGAVGSNGRRRLEAWLGFVWVFWDFVPLWKSARLFAGGLAGRGNSNIKRFDVCVVNVIGIFLPDLLMGTKLKIYRKISISLGLRIRFASKGDLSNLNDGDVETSQLLLLCIL